MSDQNSSDSRESIDQLKMKHKKFSDLQRGQSLVIKSSIGINVDRVPTSSGNTPNKRESSDHVPTPTRINEKNYTTGDYSNHHRKRTHSGRSLLLSKPFNTLSASIGNVTPENKNNFSNFTDKAKIKLALVGAKTSHTLP